MSLQSKIRARKRAEFRQRQQYNQIVAELNRQRQGGQAQATTNQPVVVEDGDTLSSLASANGTTEQDILSANPELKYVRTGMVLNTPTPAPLPGSEGWRVQNVGGIGLPSNAALGATSANLQGSNYYQSEKGGAAVPYLQQLQANQQRQQQAVLGALQPGRYPGIGNAGAQRQYPLYSNNAVPPQRQYPLYGGNNNPQGPYPLYAGNTVTTPGPYPVYAQGVLQMQADRARSAAQTSQEGTAATAPPLTADRARTRGFAPRGNFTTFINTITAATGPTGRLPTDFELQYLIEHGRVKKSAPSLGGGGYYYGRRRRGGGGGGGKRKTATGGGPNKRPAFGSGSGFSGLVNWRI